MSARSVGGYTADPDDYSADTRSPAQQEADVWTAGATVTVRDRVGRDLVRVEQGIYRSRITRDDLEAHKRALTSGRSHGVVNHYGIWLDESQIDTLLLMLDEPWGAS